jgi:hypothetical protein
MTKDRAGLIVVWASTFGGPSVAGATTLHPVLLRPTRAPDRGTRNAHVTATAHRPNPVAASSLAITPYPHPRVQRPAGGPRGAVVH